MGASQPPEQPPAPPPAAASFRSRDGGGAVVQVPVAAGFTAGLTGDTESEVSSVIDDVEETVNDLSLPIHVLLGQRQTALDDLIVTRGRLGVGAGQAASGRPIQMLQRPTASKINYQSLHPAIFRYIEPISELDEVARRLGVNGWRAEARRIWRIRPIRDAFRAFVGLPNDAPEARVEGMLFRLILDVARDLNLNCSPHNKQCALVRGTLARDHLVVRGVVDLVFYVDDKPILAAEVKTAQSWTRDDTWYVKSRGAQLFQTLYAAGCPTLVVSQNQFKLFWENNERSRVATYPSEPTDGDARDAEDFRDTMCNQPTDDQLFDVLVICLLRAERMGPAVASPTRPAARAPEWSNNVNESTNSSPPKSRARANRARPRDRRTGTARRVGGRAVPRPSFFTGVYDANGEPVFRTVHAELVEQFELDSSCSDSDDALSSCDETPGSSGAVKAVLPTHDSAVAL